MQLQITGVTSYLEQRTEIHCHMKTGCTLIHWDFLPVGAAASAILFASETKTVHPNFSKSIEVDDKNISVLILRRVEAPYAGTYKCLMNCVHLEGNGICEDIAELIVICKFFSNSKHKCRFVLRLVLQKC